MAGRAQKPTEKAAVVPPQPTPSPAADQPAASAEPAIPPADASSPPVPPASPPPAGAAKRYVVVEPIKRGGAIRAPGDLIIGMKDDDAKPLLEAGFIKKA